MAQRESDPTIPFLFTEPPPGPSQAKTSRDARTIRDLVQDVPPDAEALPKPSRFAAEASHISERASPKDLSILPSSARNLSFADETETQISGGHSPFIAAPFIEQAPALAASALGRTSAFAAVQPESAVAESTRAILRQIVGKDGAAVEIALFPKELGQIRLQIEQSPEGARILVTAERAEIAALIRHHAAELAQEFRSTGMSNPMITVQSGDPSRDNRGDGSGSNAPFTQAPIQSEGGQSGQMTGNHSGDRAAPQPGSQPLHTPQEQAPAPTDSPPSNPSPGLPFPTEGGLILRL